MVHLHNLAAKHKARLLTLNLIAGLSVLSASHHAGAVEIQKQVLVPLGVEYDTNPDMSPATRYPVWRYTATPRLILNIDDGSNTWLVDGSVLVQRNSNDDAVLKHREDPSITLGWRRVLERGTIAANARYAEASSRNTEFRTTGFLAEEGTTYTKAVDATWTHSLSERLLFSLAGLHDDISFTGVGLTNYTLSTVTPTLTYSLNERVDPFVQLRYSHLNPEDGIDSSDLTAVVVGVNVKASEKFSWGVRAGGNNISGLESRTPWTGGVTAEYTTDKTRTTFELARTIAGAGIGGFLESDDLRAGWAYDISQINRAGVDLLLHDSRGDEYKARQLGGWFERDLGRHWMTRLTLVRKESEYAGEEAGANVLGVAVIFNSLNF